MKLRLFLAICLLLALGGAVTCILAHREGGFSALSSRVQNYWAEFRGQGAAQPPAEGPAGQLENQNGETAQPQPAVETEPMPAETPAPEPEPEPEPASEPKPEPAPEPEPAPDDTSVPQSESIPVTSEPAPQPVPAEPAMDYGKPGEGHGPELYPEEFELFCGRLDEQVKLNVYDFCPAIQVLLEATNDEFALTSWMQAAADRGNAAAMHFIADVELAYVPEDELQSPRIRKAYELMRKSAELGYDPSKCSLSECLYNGIGTRKEVAESKKVLTEACKGGSFIPRLRWLLLNDRMKTYDDRERAEVKAEIDRGNHYVIYYMSRLAPSSSTQLEWLQKAVELGNPDACYELATVIFKTSPKDGYELLKEAAKLHNRDALFLLGSSLLDNGSSDPLARQLGLQPNEPAALRLIKTAAAMRSPRAVYFMGRSYYEGLHGMPQDKSLAYRHFSQALALRSPDSGAAMGLMLLRGEGVEKDDKRGLGMITLAANSRYPYAIVLMAYACYNGLGTPADANKATELLQDAAALGMPEAYVYLAFITTRGGEGLKANPDLAASYLRMAAVDMGEKAAELYAELESAGAWEPLP